MRNAMLDVSELRFARLPGWRSLPAAVSRPVSLALSLVLLSISVLLLGDLFGLRSSDRDQLASARKMAAEALALHLSTLAEHGDEAQAELSLQRFAASHPDVVAASLKRTQGLQPARQEDPARRSEAVSSTGSTLDRLHVPIFSGALPWGEVRIVFASGTAQRDELVWLGIVALGSFTSFLAFLARVLVQLDPGRAVPTRVQTALNLFSSGVVILDDRLRVVMINHAAAAIVDKPPNQLTGRALDAWPWETTESWQAPWLTALHSGLAASDQSLALRGPDGQSRIYRVNCACVGDGESAVQGVMVTLDDLTPLERKNRQLAKTLTALRRSQAELTEKSRALELLATTDPLTGIANRRTLMERLQVDIERARSEGSPLSCIMSDIDHFKSVNDTYGHAVGDEVIRAVANTFQRLCRDGDTVGRYGGEEFVLVLPGLDAAGATQVAERVRVAVMALALGDRLAVPHLSASFGVADLDDAMRDEAALVDCADQALYTAKHAGRNRVGTHDRSAAAPASSQALPAPGSDAQVAVLASSEDLARARVLELESLLAERQRDIERLREFDSLTGVPMRTLFLQRVEMELVRSERHDTLVGVMSFELRDLPLIVTTFGHVASDALVIAFVERLRIGLRATDLVSLIVGQHSLSRVTSNEYGVLLSELTDTAGALVVVTRLKRLLSEPFMIGEQRVYVGVNIGIALSDSVQQGAAKVFAQASDARLEAAGKPDKVSHSFASSSLDEQSNDYIRLEADLREAIQAGALQTWFQPKFDLAERRVTGMEALLRWPHETRGFVPPDVFVAVAEANGMIEQLSSLVLGQTLNQIRVWNAMGFDDLRVSINISPLQLRAETLVNETLEALAKAGVGGRQLEIELTETSVLSRPEEARQALMALREAGVTLSMDDFGTGYTSLALLARLPLDTVKIDRSFVVAMAEGERPRAVIESIIQMARALDLRVVAEGVETNEELELLARFGCSEIQGFLISHPCPAEEISTFLVHQRAAEGRRRA